MTVIISGDTGIDTVGSNTVGNGQLIDGSVQLAKLGFTPPFTKEFISPEQTITLAGLISVAHGLGVLPKLVQVVAICKTAELGYSVGDIIVATLPDSLGTAAGYGLQILLSGTNIDIRVGNTGFVSIMNKATGAFGATATAANWRLIVRAWA